MDIGAHVSPAGGPANAIGRGVERASTAIQFFNQNPRAWRSRVYREDEAAAFREAQAGSPVKAVLIHAVYLINCASEDPEILGKSLESLKHSLSSAALIGADAVVLHAGSAKAGDVTRAIERAGATIREALEETDGCPLHLENTAGAGGTLGRSFEELAALIEAAGGDERLGVCVDSCHLFASGFDIRTRDGLASVVDRCFEAVGAGRLGSLHLNDSQTPLGSNRDRHAVVGEGELGRAGCAVFLSEPRFEDLPLVIETPGASGRGPDADEVGLAWKLRERGLKAREKG
ncbi:MAG TPA: deoxyribonuclease IV [Solirubrobacteraceae bacterium]|nr:deoxyribonuclease IV [Solirubrobacteraceae bacterium]